MTTSTSRPRPQEAIESRRRDAAAKVAAVGKVVRAVGRSGVPVTRAGAARLAGVSRSFTYQNEQVDAMIVAAQARTQVAATQRVATQTAQQEAAWRERALNAEDQIRVLRRELSAERQKGGPAHAATARRRCDHPDRR